MGLTKHRLGEFIERREETNADLAYGLESVRGVNNLKKLMPTKADLNNRDLSKFQIVCPGEFVFNHRTSRNGSKFSIALNDGQYPVICTEDYVVFRIKESAEQTILAEWIYMFFNRPEFDRYVITNSWGSSTEFYNWEDICDVEIELPPIEIQQKYVNIYKAMVANQQSYERGLEDLKLAADSLLERHKGARDKEILRNIVREIDIRNKSYGLNDVFGVNKDKQFMPTVTSSEDVANYKIVAPGQFACNLMHIGRDVMIPAALNHANAPIAVSPAYLVFEVDRTDINSEFLLMWLSRKETERRAWFMCDNSVRSGMDKRRFFETPIPIPSYEEQEVLVSLYSSIRKRQTINEQMKKRIKDICPILIRGSLEDGG